MQLQYRFCIVESTFTVTKRGTAIQPREWETGQVKVGDWVEVRRQDGGVGQTQVKSIDIGRRTTPGPAVMERGVMGVLFTKISRDDVKPGDELWSVVNPPQEEMMDNQQSVAAMKAKRSLWQRLFGEK